MQGSSQNHHKFLNKYEDEWKNDIHSPSWEPWLLYVSGELAWLSLTAGKSPDSGNRATGGRVLFTKKSVSVSESKTGDDNRVTPGI